MKNKIEINVPIFFCLDLFVVGHVHLLCVVFNSIGTLFDIVEVVKRVSNIEFAKPFNLEGKNGLIIFYTISVDTNT